MFVRTSFRKIVIANIGPLCTFARYSTTRKSIKKLLSNPEINTKIQVEGWLKSVRQHKDISFLQVSDGSCLQSLQVVCSGLNFDKNINYGSCVSVTGQLVESQKGQQNVELVAEDVSLVGECKPEDYPFNARKKHPADYTRNYLHLRPKTNSASALLRIRNHATMQIHKHFQDNEFCFIHTPILTAIDCEGGVEVFQVEPAGLLTANEPKAEDQQHFFDRPTYLTVSGQLHLEAITGSMSKVYNFGPIFRADKSRGRHHLAEFYMVEAEVAFLRSLDPLMEMMESLVKNTFSALLHTDDVQYYLTKQNESNHMDIVENTLSRKFERISYTEAIKLLEKNNDSFKFKVVWGCDLQKEHEKHITKLLGDVPVFVTDFPQQLKPFYALDNDDGKTVAAVDLLVPTVGELVGGTLREHRHDVLRHKLDAMDTKDDYDWYLDIRKFGGAPHGGFGMGFERYLQYLLGVANIRDVIPFPRWAHSCKA